MRTIISKQLALNGLVWFVVRDDGHIESGPFYTEQDAQKHIELATFRSNHADQVRSSRLPKNPWDVAP